MKRLGGFALVLGLVVLGGSPPAGAEGELEVETPGGDQLFELDDLAPGMVGSETLVITNQSSDSGDLVVQVVDLVDDDNGCNDAETAHPDTSCGADGGELSRDLLVTITDDDGVSRYAGSLRALADGTLIDRSLPSGEQLELTFDWEFVSSSPNDTQTDRVAFDVEISLTNDTETQSDVVEVAGVSVRRSSAVEVMGARLPRTGADVGWAAQVGAVALTSGAAMTALATRRARRRAPHER